ncbi:MAG: hypothetical protein KC421_20225 [Anaerolineales bacterium]|nr:hypothetical protein [Anaerolineales bacterium]
MELYTKMLVFYEQEVGPLFFDPKFSQKVSNEYYYTLSSHFTTHEQQHKPVSVLSKFSVAKEEEGEK